MSQMGRKLAIAAASGVVVAAIIARFVAYSYPAQPAAAVMHGAPATMRAAMYGRHGNAAEVRFVIHVIRDTAHPFFLALCWRAAGVVSGNLLARHFQSWRRTTTTDAPGLGGFKALSAPSLLWASQ